MVAPIVAGSLIAGGASLLGGLFGGRSQSRADQSNAALQREFAQKSIQWRVDDAKAAGIHPLAALGASTTSAAPSYVGANPASGLSRAGSRVGQAIAGQGQNTANIENTKASTDLIRQQILASRQAMALEAANRTQDFQDVQPATPAQVHPSNLLPRDTATGSTVIKNAIPPGTPQEMLEQEFGDIAQLSPNNISRWYKYLQNTRQVGTLADVKMILDSWRRKGINQKLERKMRAAEKRTRPGAYEYMFKNRRYYGN